MKWNKKLFSTLLLAAVCLILTSCDKKQSDTHLTQRSNRLKVGVTSSADQSLTEHIALIAKEKYNLDIEFINFTSYLVPNEALNSKELDANAFQHFPFFEQQIKDNNYQLVVIGKTFIYPIAGYSNKIKSINDIQSGNLIAIPDDPSNLGRSLLLLQQAKLIRLTENIGLTPTQLDIIENPLQLKIIEIEAPQLTHALNDPKITLAIINSGFATQIGLNPSRDSIIIENSSSPYANIIAARVDNQDDERLQLLLKAYHDPSTVQKATELFDGAAIPGW